MKRDDSRRGQAAKPSERLAAIAAAGRARKPRAPKAAEPVLVVPPPVSVRTKFVVVDKVEMPVVVGTDLVTKYRVTLKAAYEAQPIHNGLATIQGNIDNRIYGFGEPEAVIVKVLESKAVADTFLVGRAFLVDFTDVFGAA